MDETNECWIAGDRDSAQFEAWLLRELARLVEGPISARAHVRLRCHNPDCRRPDHLFRVEPAQRSPGQSRVELVPDADRVQRGVQFVLALPDREETHETYKATSARQ